MAKGQLPKAYLRVDPNLDQTHPDPGLFVRLLCAGARQPRRGLFKDRKVIDRCLGRRASERLLERGDVIVREDGAVVIDGWDIWQEGDLTVGERMKRYRNKERNSTVTQPSPRSNSPSEAVGSRRKAAETDNGNGTDSAPTGAAIVVARSWSTEAADDWTEVYGGQAPAQFFAHVKPIAKRWGWDRTRPVLKGYMRETPVEYLAVTKVVGGAFEQLERRLSAGAGIVRAGPLSAKAETRRAAMVAAITGGLKGDGSMGGRES